MMLEYAWIAAQLVSFVALIAFLFVDHLDAHAPDVEVPTATARERRT